MTTTAHEDQFTAEPEHVAHRPYDTAAILRQNVADLERELQRQRERADKAESAMASAREDLQSFIDARDAWMARANAAEAELKAAREQEPVAWKHENGNVFLPWQKDLIVTGAKFSPLYTRPIPAPAVAVPSDVARCIRESRQLAMDMVIKARIPESGDFAVIAQSLDYVADWLQPAQQDDSGNGDAQ